MNHKAKTILVIVLSLAVIAIIIGLAVGLSSKDSSTLTERSRELSKSKLPTAERLRASAAKLMKFCDHDTAYGNNEFGKRFLIYSRSDGEEPQNFVLSPFSASSLMAMTLIATKGETAKEIRNSMTFPCDDSSTLNGYENFTASLENPELTQDFNLSVANRIFVDDRYKLNPEFKSKSAKYFGASPESRDFSKHGEQTRVEINQWVERQTNDKIQDLLPPGSVRSDSGAVLVNAVYFKGKWKLQFDPSDTTPEKFYLAPEALKNEVPTMYLSAKDGELPYAVFTDNEILPEGTKILELPYEGDRLSMYLFLPPKDVYTVYEIEDALLGKDLEEIFEEYQGNKSHVDVQLPKFEIKSTHDVGLLMSGLGIDKLFTPGEANFSGLIDGHHAGLHVSGIIQKAFIEVNEEGSEAAAATGIVMRMGFAGLQEKEIFTFNRPFVFLIRDKYSRMNLFSGRVLRPDK